MIELVGVQLNQWDVDRVVKVTGEASHVHFANQGDSKAVIMDIVGGEAKIPNYLLQTGKALHAYAVLDGVTMEIKVFAVRKRERPENYIYEDDYRNYIYDLTNRVEEAISEARQTASPLRVEINPETYANASHTSAEIYAHVSAGGSAVLYDSQYGICYNMLSCRYWETRFGTTEWTEIYDENGVNDPYWVVRNYGWIIDDIGTVTLYDLEVPIRNANLGDIATALDTIIAMQDELVGGAT